MRLIALVLCGMLVTVLAPACDLSYDRETVEPGGAGTGIPTDSVGAGDSPAMGETAETKTSSARHKR